MSKTTILATALGMIIVAAIAVAVISASLGEFPPVKSGAATSDNKSGPPSTADDKAVASNTGLKIVDIKEGTGKEAKAGSNVKVHYTGWLESGEKFDSSLDRNEPFPVTIGKTSVIKGWTEGLQGIKAGGKRKLIIPPELGYGGRGQGPIPANSTLIFEVEVLEVD